MEEIEKIIELKQLLDNGTIDQAKFKKLKEEILNKNTDTVGSSVPTGTFAAFFNAEVTDESDTDVLSEGAEASGEMGITHDADIIEEYCYFIVSNLPGSDEPLDGFVKEIREHIENSSFNLDDLAASLSHWANDKNIEGDTVKGIQIGKIILELTQRGGPAFALGVAYEKCGDKENALKYYIMSAEIREERLGRNHEGTVEAVKEATRINNELGRMDWDLPAWFEDAGDDIDFDF